MRGARLFVLPAAVLAVAAALYGAALWVPVHYGLVPVRIPIALRDGATYTAAFRAKRDTTYILTFELQQRPLMFDWPCLLGLDNPLGGCKGVTPEVDIAWSVTAENTIVAQGDTSQRVHGFPWDDRISRVIGKFEGARGRDYVVRIASRTDGRMLDEAGPRFAVQADSYAVQRTHRGVFMMQVTGVPWLYIGAALFAVIGALMLLYAAARLYVLAPAMRADAAGPDAIAEPPQADRAETFRIDATYRRSIAVTAWVSAALTAVLAYFVLSLSMGKSASPKLLGLLVLGCICTLLIVRAWRDAGRKVEVDASGIAEVRPNGTRIKLNWHDIRAIVHRPYARRLELRSAGPAIRTVRIEEQTARFDVLRDLVIGRAPQAAIEGADAPARRARNDRRIARAFWAAVLGLAIAPWLWETALFDALPAGAAADRAVLQKSARTLSLYRGDTVLKRYRVALRARDEGSAPAAASPIEEGWYRAEPGLSKRYGDALVLRRASADAAAQPDANAATFMIHGPEFLHGFLARLHRLLDWTDNAGVTGREIDELRRVVAPGTRVEVRP